MWYLPGVGSGTGTGLHEKLTPSAFSGPKQINRALHLAGGDVQAEVEGLGEHYSIALWFWLGEASGASERSGTLIAGPCGESLVSRQFKDHHVQLVMNGSTSKLDLRADDWHFAVLVRDGREVRIYVDGNEQPEIVRRPRRRRRRDATCSSARDCKASSMKSLFSRALSRPRRSPDSGRCPASRNNAPRTPPNTSAPRRKLRSGRNRRSFPRTYNAAITALKPIMHLPLDSQPASVSIEQGVQFSPVTFASFDSGRIRTRTDTFDSGLQRVAVVSQ